MIVIPGAETLAALLDPAAPVEEAGGLLRGLGFAEPGPALENLRRLAGTEREREHLLRVLPRLLRHLAAAADPDQALNHLERLAAAALDRAAFFRLLHEHPEATLVVVTLGSASQFLAEAVVRSPQILPWLLDPAVMRARTREAMHQEVAAACRPFQTLEGRANALRRVQRRELCRIGLRDALGDADFVATTQELSNLADACIAQAWALVAPGLRARHGVPRHPGPDGTLRETGFAVIALGKLGGEELNYASDVDLCFVYEAEGATDGPEPVSNRVFFARAVERLVAVLSEATEEGWVYRVDLRLRPEGSAGPPALPLAAYRQYYETRAAPWERQALIKARVAAGDARVGQAFLELARAVSYAPGREREVLGDVRAMRGRIDRLVRARGQHERHVKLGVGGIRDIEFLVQGLQLLYGPADPWLREANTLRALHRLAERGYLSWEESGVLGRAYVFLRTVEHRLQILHALKTHTLPRGERELARLARRLGYQGEDEAVRARFLQDYHRTRQAVRAAFEACFDAAAELRDPGPPPVSREAVAAVPFTDPARARQNLALLWEGPPLAPAPRRVRESLRTLLPAVLQALRTVPDPDAALDALERYAAAAGPRVAYLSRLAGDPGLLGRVLVLFARAERFARLLIARPELLLELGDPRAAVADGSVRGYLKAFAGFAVPGVEDADRLRLFKQTEELRLGWAELLGGLPPARAERALSALAAAVLGLAWQWAEAEVARRCARPRAGGRWVPALVVGLGKFGGRELDYGSDLDLVVVYGERGEPAPADAASFYDQVADRTHQLLSAITRTGQAFRVDFRLRPWGKGVSLAHSLEVVDRYLETAALLWERQALVRARPVWGEPALARAFLDLRRTRVFEPGLTDAERAEIHHVRLRMERELGREGPGRLHLKFGRGGLCDIEFLVQVLQLAHGRRHPALRTPSTRAALRALARLGLLAPGAAATLMAAYEWEKGLLRALRLAGARPADCLPMAGPLRERLAREAGCGDGRGLLERYRAVAEAVRQHYLEVVGG